MNDIFSIYYLLRNSLDRINTDSRSLNPGDIFLTLKGDRFNGNDFIEIALSKGVEYVIADQYEGTDPKVILVSNAYSTLVQLAAIHRKNLKTQIIAITGTNGKTTTKELLFHIISKQNHTLATSGNLNNHIGVPLTLLKLKPYHEILVLEMGANKKGDIMELCEIADPDSGLITNIGVAHLEGFGDQNGILDTKTELFDFLLQKNSKVFFNVDSQILNFKYKQYSTIATSYGTHENEDVDYLFELNQAFPHINLSVINRKQTFSFTSKLFGSHNFENLTAAITVALETGITPENIQKGIDEYIPSNMRSQIISWKGATILLDAYNANPSSMRKAVDSILAFKANKKWLILGGMAELGNQSVIEHQSLLREVMDKKFDQIVLVGKAFHECLGDSELLWFPDTLSCKSWFDQQDLNDIFILIKGSRSIGLEGLLTDELH